MSDHVDTPAIPSNDTDPASKPDDELARDRERDPAPALQMLSGAPEATVCTEDGCYVPQSPSVE